MDWWRTEHRQLVNGLALLQWQGSGAHEVKVSKPAAVVTGRRWGMYWNFNPLWLLTQPQHCALSDHAFWAQIHAAQQMLYVCALPAMVSIALAEAASALTHVNHVQSAADGAEM